VTTKEKQTQGAFIGILFVIALVVNTTALAVRQLLWPSRYSAPIFEQPSFTQPPQQTVPQQPTLTRKQELDIENEAAAKRIAQEEAAEQRRVEREEATAQRKAEQARQQAAENAAMAARKAAEQAMAAHA